MCIPEELDMGTLAWTRGRAFLLSRLTGLVCTELNQKARVYIGLLTLEETR